MCVLPLHLKPTEPRHGRATCYRCRRAAVVCLCDRIAQLPTNSHIMYLVHPREAYRKTSSGLLAHHALPNSTYAVGLEFAADGVVQERLTAWRDRTWLLFPGAKAQAASAESPIAAGRSALYIVIESTWSQAQTILRLNESLRQLPRLSVTQAGPSQFRFRRQPRPDCLSTIEATAALLRARGELSQAASQQLLQPFYDMVELQIRYQQEYTAKRAQNAAILTSPQS